MHYSYLSLTGSQLTVPYLFWDMCDILCNCRQKRMHLFCEIWILFFGFFSIFYFTERLGYNAESKHNQNEAVRSYKVCDAYLVLNIWFSNVKTLILHWLCKLLCEPFIPQTLFPQVCNPGNWLENLALFEYCYI